MNPFSRGNRKRREEPLVKLPAIPWAGIMSGLAVVLVLAGGYAGGRWLLDRPVARVVINGEFERVSADGLEAVLRPYMGRGFLAAPLDSIQQKVREIPWDATARVSRKWPDTLEVTITEEEPAARWGEAGLLNPQGRLFVRHASHVPAELPRLNGPEGTQAEVAARYVAIQEQLVQRGLGLASLELDGRGAWSFQLRNGIQVRLGSLDVDVRLARFYDALDKVIAGVADDVRYIDMRYTNGFAVGWKQDRRSESMDEDAMARTVLPNA
jgi:cell division protein FtsQ